MRNSMSSVGDAPPVYAPPPGVVNMNMPPPAYGEANMNEVKVETKAQPPSYAPPYAEPPAQAASAPPAFAPPTVAPPAFSNAVRTPNFFSEFKGPPAFFSTTLSRIKRQNSESIGMKELKEDSVEKGPPVMVCEDRYCDDIAKSGSCYCQAHHENIILTPQMNRWRGIPTVIGVKICEYLPIITIIGMSSTCKQWDKFTYNESLWVDLVSKMEKQKSEHIAMITAKYPNSSKYQLETTFNSEISTLKRAKLQKTLSRTQIYKRKKKEKGPPGKAEYSSIMSKVLSKAEEQKKAEEKRRKDREKDRKRRQQRERRQALLCLPHKKTAMAGSCFVTTCGITVTLFIIPLILDGVVSWSWGTALVPLLIAFALSLLLGLCIIPHWFSDELNGNEAEYTAWFIMSKGWFLFVLLLFLKIEAGWVIPNLIIVAMPIGMIILMWISGFFVAFNDDQEAGVLYCMATPFVCLIPLTLVFICIEADMETSSPISRDHAFIPLWIAIGFFGLGSQGAVIGFVAPIVFFVLIYKKYASYGMNPLSWVEVFIPLWITIGCMVCGVAAIALND